MEKTIVDKVLERTQGLCQLCGSNDRVQIHHILSGNGRRKQQEREETLIPLCWEHHHGTYGVHGAKGQDLNKQLKRMLQYYYVSQGLSEDEIREKMGGRLY